MYNKIERFQNGTTNSVTENGAVGYASSGTALVDFNFGISSFRNSDVRTIWEAFYAAFREDADLAFRMLFFARDVRAGMGERRLFRVCLANLMRKREQLGIKVDVIKLCQYIMKYGRADDMLVLLDTDCRDGVVSFILETLKADMKAMENKEPVTLLAKWLPTPNTSSKKTRALARKLATKLCMTDKQYRKTLSALRSYSDVIEVKMTANEWGKINYNAVPSKANLAYKQAFIRHDGTRRAEYLEALNKGDKEVKINASVAYPCDIVHKYMTNNWYISKYDATLEAMWKALPDMVKGDSSTIVVSDGSGSMTRVVDDKSGMTPLNVAQSLAIYFSERAKGDYKDTFITFSERPRIVHLGDCASLHDKLNKMSSYNEVANTNIEAVFDLILNTAVTNNMSQDEMPDRILILSDMEFDACVRTDSDGIVTKVLFEELQSRYAEKGYKMPRLVFWNIYSRTRTVPVQENDAGVALVSGFSPNIMEMVMSNETDPFKCLKAKLMTYDIGDALWV